MSTLAALVPRRGVAGRVWAALVGVWGAVTGLAPHVLHHVGPLAGAALLAGTGGTLLFAGIAIVVSIPFLLRIYRRFRTWMAPAVAFAVMAAAFSLSSFVIGPAISGSAGSSRPVPGTPQPASHERHH